jgi:hypothetical protein
MKKDLGEWLKRTCWDKIYWSEVHAAALAIESDGCSCVPDWMIWTCWEHDIHYRTHSMLDGEKITRAQADYVFRRRIQQYSGWGRLSPVSWWRWAFLRMFGERAWNKRRPAAEQMK